MWRAYAQECRSLGRLEEGVGSTGAKVANSCEKINQRAGNRTLVLCKRVQAVNDCAICPVQRQLTFNTWRNPTNWMVRRSSSMTAAELDSSKILRVRMIHPV